jgi:hypothetical protein
MKAHAAPILKLINILLLILYYGTPAFSKPGDSHDLGDMVSQAGLFSYQAPKGWSVKSTPCPSMTSPLMPRETISSRILMSWSNPFPNRWPNMYR